MHETTEETTASHSVVAQDTIYSSLIETMYNPSKHAKNPQKSGPKSQTQAERYLQADTLCKKQTLSSAWKSIEYQFPVVAHMAKDVLSVVAAEVGPEQTFSLA